MTTLPSNQIPVRKRTFGYTPYNIHLLGLITWIWLGTSNTMTPEPQTPSKTEQQDLLDTKLDLLG
jgi:hypothetical protein